MKAFTTIGRGFFAPCLPAGREAWQAARQDEGLARLCQQIRQSDNADEQRRLKGMLPVWTPRCAGFRQNHRAELDADKRLMRQMFDIDEKGHTDEILARMVRGAKALTAETAETASTAETTEMYIGPFMVLMVEESVRRGTHVLVITPKGMGSHEAQHVFSQCIDLPVDPAVKNVAGCIYMVPDSYVRYQSEAMFDPDYEPAGAGVNPDEPTVAAPAQAAAAQAAAAQAPAPAQEAPAPAQATAAPAQPQAPATAPAPAQAAAARPSHYNGVPYGMIVEALAEQLGGAPEHGSRNNFLFAMACYLRYVCNDDPEWIRQVMPTYGESPEHAYPTITSACHRSQARRMPPLMLRALQVAQSRLKQQEREKADPATMHPLSAPTPPPLPEVLPPLIALLVSKVPDMYKAAVAQAVFAPLGAHVHGVRIRYIDNVEHDLGGCMCVCMARQSIGKGAVDKPIELILEDISRRDKEMRQREKQCKDFNRTAKSDEKKQPRPTDLVVQSLMSNMTNAALVQRLVDAEANGGRFLYVKMDEIELLDKIQATGGSSPSEIIRLAFTQSLYGQERVGNDSVSGTPPLRLNFNASTTEYVGRRYFRNDLQNGTLTRLTFCTVIRPEGRHSIPRYGDYDEAYRHELRTYLQHLDEAHGVVKCTEAEALAEALVEENCDFYELSNDNAFEVLSYRAARIAYDKALMLYLAMGRQWHPANEAFCRWSMLYDLWCKLHFFGHEMRQQEQQFDQSQLVASPGPRNLLELLPDTFTLSELQTVHRHQGLDGNVRGLVNTWTFRGYVEPGAEADTWRKTLVYLGRSRNPID